MLAFTIRRLGQSLFVLVVMSFLVFLGVYAVFCFYLERVLPPGY